ncbi:MAG: O-antigen ligase domain-containing protein [Cyanobacteria bacterium J06638_6]
MTHSVLTLEDERQARQKLILLGTLCVMTLLGSLTGPGLVVRLFFIGASVAIAFYLYSKSTPEYVSFVFWIWFLAPFFRRFSDYYNGFDDLGIVILAPFLVTLIAAIKLIQNPGQLGRAGHSSFTLVLAAIAYSFWIGWLSNPPVAVIRASLDWFPPVVLGLFLALHWRLYPQIKRSMQKTFAWGTLVMGSYGIYQYVVAPAWDVYWMNNATIASVGRPAAFSLRVWSTMNAPGPFAIAILAGVMILLSYQPPIFLPSFVTGFLSFLLAGVRSAWVGWAVAQFMLMGSIKQNIQIRLILVGAVLVLMLVPLSTMPPFDDAIGDRVSSLFNNVQNDSSYRARTATYDENLSIALSSYLGRGLGGTLTVTDTGSAVKVALDSGVLDLFFTLGWVGALPYLAGLTMLFLRQFFTPESRSDVFVAAARSITAACLVQMLFGNTAVGVGGLMLWSFLGVNLAAQRYYAHQRHQQMALLLAPDDPSPALPLGTVSPPPLL